MIYDKPHAQRISIHAPREGSDPDEYVGYVTESWEFLSTLPARGATVRPKAVRPGANRFLSTLPARGATGVGAARGQL